DALHLDVAQIQSADRAAQLVQLQSLTGRLGDFHRGAAPEVDAQVQARIEAADDSRHRQDRRQDGETLGVFDELKVRLVRQQFDKRPTVHRHYSAIGSFFGLATLSQ